MTHNLTPQAARIRVLNDQFRQTGLGGQILLTQGISALPFALQGFIASQVQAFEAFTEDNDPHGEHDFGSFVAQGHKVFWKIDYYAPDMRHGSEDPADSTKTVRVLTIMLAEEY